MSSGLLGSGIAPRISPVALELAAAQAGWHPAEFFLPPPSVIVNQGELPCCVSCAIATCVEVLNPSWAQLAPLFHFYMFNFARQAAEPTTFESMTLGEGLNTLALSGICLQRCYPVSYTEDGVRVPPSDHAVVDASSRRMLFDSNREVGGFGPLSDSDRVNEWKIALLGRRPILVGFYKTDQYGPEMDRLHGHPDFREPHAVAVLGYRESERSFLAQDSYGQNFAQGGQWWLPYDLVLSAVVEQAYVVGYPTA